MKNVVFLFLISPLILFSQVGINTTTPEGILDLNSTTQGILVPRVPLTEIMVDLPVINPNGGNLENSTLVYNTQTMNDVSPGFYYWKIDQWIRVGSNEGYMSFTTITLPLPSLNNSDVDFKLDGVNYNKNVFRILHNGADLDGIKNGIHGKVIHLYNGHSSKDLKLISKLSSVSLTQNQFSIQGDVVLKPGSALILIYDGLYFNQWIVLRTDN